MVFIVRTKQLKVLFLFIVMLTIFSSPVSPVAAAEQDNVDSFDVHPANRWNDLVTTITPSVNNGLLNISDVGDGSSDIYRTERGLRKQDGTVTVRFKVFHSSNTGASDRFIFFIAGTSGQGDVMQLRLDTRGSDLFFNTLLQFTGADGTGTLTFTGDERVKSDLWYILELKYNQLESKFRATLQFDNETRVWRKNVLDISTTNRPLFFTKDRVFVGMSIRTNTAARTEITLIDFIDAPFKEREWENVEVPVGFNSNAWDGASAEDNINDQSRWQLVVPLLDSAAGLMSIDYTNFAGFISGDGVNFYFRVFAVDADDGDLHEALEVRLRLEHSIPPSVVVATSVSIRIGDTTTLPGFQFNLVDGQIPGLSFSVGLRENREVLTVKTRYYKDISDSTSFNDVTASVDLTTVATDLSSEFVLEYEHDHDYDGNIDMVSMVTDFAFQERDIFTEVISGVQGFFEGILIGLISIFTVLFRFFATAIDGVGASINSFLSPLLLAITAAITVLAADIFGLFTGILTTIGDAVTDLAGDIWSAFLGLASDVSDFIDAVFIILVGSFAEMITAVVNWLAASVDDFISTVIFPLIIGILDDLGITPLLEFVATFITDLALILSSILSLITALFGWFFAVATFWFNIDRLGALFTWLTVGLVTWLLLPFIQLFVEKDLVDWDFNDMATLFKETTSSFAKIFDFGFKIFTYLFDTILNLLKVIGNYIPFT